MKKDRLLNLQYAALQAAFWMSFLVPVTFAANFLQALGYSNAALGLIFAFGNISGVVVGSVVASVIDRYEKVTVLRTVPFSLLAEAAAYAVLLLCPVRGAAVSVCFTLAIALSALHNTLNTKLCVDLEHYGHTINYGAARAMGSLGFVVLSAIMGVIVEKTSVFILPWIKLALIAVQACVYTAISRTIRDELRTAEAGACAPGASQAAEATSLFGFFKKYKRLMVMFCGATLIFCCHNTTTNFMINVTENIGGDTSDMGNLSSFMALMELPMMLLMSRAIKKVKVSNLMYISFAVFAVKGFAIAFTPTVGAMYAVFILQAFSFAIYTPGIVPYLERTVPYEDSAKAQMLGYAVTTLGSVLCSLVCGRLYDSLPVRSVLLIAAFLGLAGSVISCLGVQNVEKA